MVASSNKTNGLTFFPVSPSLASTVYCFTCDNLGVETYVKDGQQGYGPCPDCINRKRGLPIPPSEVGVPDGIKV